eukprot:1807986-Pyramimonas_sp.AAC.1
MIRGGVPARKEELRRPRQPPLVGSGSAPDPDPGARKQPKDYLDPEFPRGREVAQRPRET